MSSTQTITNRRNTSARALAATSATYDQPATPAVERLLLTVEDAGTMLGVRRSTIYALMGSGHLTARKIGRRTVITVESVRNYLATLPAADIAAPRRAA
jgi:excisionase family DNA binding protein